MLNKTRIEARIAHSEKTPNFAIANAEISKQLQLLYQVYVLKWP